MNGTDLDGIGLVQFQSYFVVINRTGWRKSWKHSIIK